jgi:flavin reductase ActVB
MPRPTKGAQLADKRATPVAAGEEPLAPNFREAMARLASAPVLVTTEIDAKPWGLTVSACCSVSADPPMILVSLGDHTASARAIGEQHRFGVSILGERLIEVARFGAAPGRPKFVQEFCRDKDGPEGYSHTPVVSQALAHLDCTVEKDIVAGDHRIFIGAVNNVLLTERIDRPLLYFQRTYHRLAGSTDLGVGPSFSETLDSLLYPYPIPATFDLRAVGSA